MSSSEDAAGRKLLQAWKATRRSMQISFTDWEGLFGVRLVGRFDPSRGADDRLFLAGEGWEAFLDAREASFKNVVSNEGLKQNLLPSQIYGESVTLCFAGKGDWTLTMEPELKEGEPHN